MVDIDTETLFDAATATLATIAALFFVVNVDLGYSPVTKAAITLAFLGGVFAIIHSTADRQLTLFGYASIITVAVGLFFEMVGAFDVPDTAVVVGLLVVAALTLGVRNRLDEDSHLVARRTARYAFVGLVTVAAVVLVVDVVTGGLAYELQLQSDVEATDTEDENLRVGSVVVSNPTPLPERVEVPGYEVCTAGNWSRYRPPSEPGQPPREVHSHLNVDDGYRDHVFGFGEKTYAVTVHVGGTNLTDATFPVQQTDSCPDDESGQPFLAVYERPDESPGYAVAV